MTLTKLALTLLLTAVSAFSYAQKDKNFYEVTIFKWTDDGSVKTRKLVKIDLKGQIYLADRLTAKKVDLATFTRSITAFLNKEKLEKIPGNDDPPRAAHIPQPGTQNINISITLLADFQKEKNLSSYTHYYWGKMGLKPNENDYSLYHYLGEQDLASIKSVLDN